MRQRDLKPFLQYCVEHGYKVVEPRGWNQEVGIKFVGNGTHFIYRNKKKGLTMSIPLQCLWSEYLISTMSVADRVIDAQLSVAMGEPVDMLD